MKLIFVEVTSLLLVTALLSSLSLQSSGAQPVTPTNSTTPIIISSTKPLSIIKTIENAINSSKICPSAKDLLKSKYLKTCDSFPYPENGTKLKPNNTDSFLCLAIYDRFFHICSAKSHSPVGSVDSSTKSSELDPAKSLLTNGTMLDSSISNVLGSKNMTPETICNTSMIHYPYRNHYNKTNDYIVQLEKDFECYGSCFKKEKLSPLCVAIKLIDEQVLRIMEATESSSKKNVIKLEALTNKTAVEPVAKKQDEQQPPEMSSDSSPKKSVEKNEEGLDKKDDELARKDVTQNAPPPVKDGKSVEDADGDSTKKVTTGSEKPSENKSTAKDAEESNFEDPLLENDPSMPGRFDPEEESAAEDDDTQLEPASSNAKDNLPRIAKRPIQDDSHFFSFFTVVGVLFIGLCIAYHHKQKILAMVLEGRRSRGGRGRRRHSSANYRKLDCTLEEAVNSQCDSNSTNVIY